MSEQKGLSTEETRPGSVAEQQRESKKLQDQDEGIKSTDEEENEEENEESDDNSVEKKEAEVCASMEACTLPWPEDKKPQTEEDDDVWSEKYISKPEDRDTGISASSQDFSEMQSQEDGIKNKNKWRESMPEGDRWRSEEIQQHSDKGGGSLADDEEEDEEEDRDMKWKAVKGFPGINPEVTIVRLSSKDLREEERSLIEETKTYRESQAEQLYSDWTQHDDKIYLCENTCGEKLKMTLSIVTGALLFPLLVWGGYKFLPFDSPLLESAPLRLVYTLRCSMFAMIPIVLGVLVQGVARLCHDTLNPLYEGNLENRQVAVHWHFVKESLALFLFYFLQLAVMATYVSQELVKLVPLLTIIFAFGRLIYWLCLSFRSSIRGFGFSFSFVPVLVMLGANLYYVCSSAEQGGVFDVAPPATESPPKQRWFR